MASTIDILWKQALKTFSGCNCVNYKLCLKNFEILKSLINKVKAEDVCVNKTILDYVCIQPAPMCVIDVFENEDLTIAIFILKTGVTLPMHNHPEMHGLLKVICGAVKINSYSVDSNIIKYLDEGKLTAAIKHPSIVIKQTDPACALTPLMRNIHEVTCLEGPAAFLDILSPPYDTSEFGKGKRECTFFKEAPTSEESNSVNLMVVDVPSNFYSRSIKYLGQPLKSS